MMVLAQIVLPPVALDSFTIASVLLAVVGTLYLAYDLLGRQHGRLQWAAPVQYSPASGHTSSGILLPLGPGSFQARGWDLDCCWDCCSGSSSFSSRREMLWSHCEQVFDLRWCVEPSSASGASSAG